MTRLRLHLKRDFESPDDRRLAVLEVASLLGSSVRLEEDARFLEIDSSDNAASWWARRLAMFEEVECLDTGDRLATQQSLLEALADPLRSQSALRLPTATRRKNEYLSHPFHKYKAKFFPRLARSLANYVVANAGGPLLDPFGGSGTLAVECSLLGSDSVVLDLDPLAAFIARQKIRALYSNQSEVVEALDAVNSSGLISATKQMNLFAGGSNSSYRLPDFLRRKIATSDVETIEGETSAIQHLIPEMSKPAADWLRLALSHALATKISLRWMGTGDNRFALTMARSSVIGLTLRHLARMRGGILMMDKTGIERDSLGKAWSARADARRLPFKDQSFAGVVTSPPYIPASSGRETYLRSRAASISALGLLTESDVLSHEKRMVGSILRGSEGHLIPDEVRDLVEWMSPQRARKPKADATAGYFEDLTIALKEIGRVLVPGGRMAMVVSARHSFYELVSREVVRTLPLAETLGKMVEDPRFGIDLRLLDVVEIELPKMDFAARPQARGAYHEAIILCEKRQR